MKLKTFVPAVIIFSVLFVFPSFSNAQSAPLSPNDLTADIKDSDAVTLNWTHPVDTSVVGFNIYRKADAAGVDYEKMNAQPVSGTSFSDKTVKQGVSYTYMCKSVNAEGLESAPSKAAGAPRMNMKTSASVTHMGKVVRIATPGDMIKYNIDFANNGYGVAKNVVIVYAIPKGTTFVSGTAQCPKYKTSISYFDEKAGKWVDKFKNEEDISKVKFAVLDDVYPITKDKSDSATLKVIVNY